MNQDSQQGGGAPAPDSVSGGDANTTVPPVGQDSQQGGGAGVPPAQAGDPEPEVVKPVAQPVLQSLDEGKHELEENPGRTSVLTDAGVLVREP